MVPEVGMPRTKPSSALVRGCRQNKVFKLKPKTDRIQCRILCYYNFVFSTRLFSAKSYQLEANSFLHMLSWAQQRKLFFISGVVLFFIVVFGGYGLFSFYKAPNCANNEKDGNERGIDCGGSCLRMCKADVSAPLIHFVRTLEVEESVWGAVASVENRNAGAGARSVPYVFKLYDDENLLLYERHGVAFIPPRKVFAIFEGQMKTGTRTPTRATFAFTSEPVFVRMTEPALTLRTQGFTARETGSFLQVVIGNPSRVAVEGIEATVLLFGTDGNVIATSATALKKLKGEESTLLTFTWPRQLDEPARIEVLYTVPGTP
ncbi:MAG: hypothetical protein UY50_C0013G0012 [Parcubacteria group bacterium GW2011_GWA2_49_9]|nr:MAG: hypothetical protein UY50_C0013G0012 [Parcubacteria group bacterium GW2011_GWA2_49_9]